MVEIGLFYGSTNGDTRRVANLIKSLCENEGWASVELLDVAEFVLEEMLDFPVLLLGAPTWNIGQLQRDWESVFEEFDDLDLRGKLVAVFGMGDQRVYPDTFADALFFVADKAQERGATLIGRVATAGYNFTQSWAVVDGQFVGLPLDDINQPELTDARVEAWIRQLRAEITSDCSSQ